MLIEKFAGVSRFFHALLRKLDVRPAAEPVLKVEDRLTVADED